MTIAVFRTIERTCEDLEKKSTIIVKYLVKL